MHASKSYNNQFLKNKALKINVKIWRCNSVLHNAKQGNIYLLVDRPINVFGAYVTHPQLGEDFSLSIASVEAHMNLLFQISLLV